MKNILILLAIFTIESGFSQKKDYYEKLLDEVEQGSFTITEDDIKEGDTLVVSRQIFAYRAKTFFKSKNIREKYFRNFPHMIYGKDTVAPWGHRVFFAHASYDTLIYRGKIKIEKEKQGDEIVLYDYIKGKFNKTYETEKFHNDRYSRILSGSDKVLIEKDVNSIIIFRNMLKVYLKMGLIRNKKNQKIADSVNKIRSIQREIEYKARKRADSLKNIDNDLKRKIDSILKQ